MGAQRSGSMTPAGHDATIADLSVHLATKEEALRLPRVEFDRAGHEATRAVTAREELKRTRTFRYTRFLREAYRLVRSAISPVGAPQWDCVMAEDVESELASASAAAWLSSRRGGVCPSWAPGTAAR